VKPTSGESRPAPRAASEALAWSIGHVFERKSVVREHELFIEALIHGRGEIDLSELRRLSEKQGLLRVARGEVSTKAVLEKEWEIICWARDGKGSSAPLNPDYKIAEESTLSEEQRNAVSYLLSRPDEVMIFRGGAGTGKSFTLREVKRGLDAGGYNVVVLAPQRKQVMALQEDGFARAETVASFLHRNRLATGSVVIVDEAGLLGVRDMREIMLLVRTNDSALILSGDTASIQGSKRAMHSAQSRNAAVSAGFR
jgi:ATP-dependent exoDNAse (exonuclease V) alpha subunit